jgi:hypothetical protein
MQQVAVYILKFAFSPLTFGSLFGTRVEGYYSTTGKGTFQSPYFRVFIWNGKLIAGSFCHICPFSPLTFGSLFGTQHNPITEAEAVITFQSPYFRVFIWNSSIRVTLSAASRPFSPLTFGSLFGTPAGQRNIHTPGQLSVPLLSGLYLEPSIIL